MGLWVAGNPAAVLEQCWVVGGDAAQQGVEDVAELSAGRDVVISATHPAPGSESELHTTTKALLAGLAGTGVGLLVVGGAGSMTVPGAGGTTVIDDPNSSPLLGGTSRWHALTSSRPAAPRPGWTGPI